MTQGLCTQNGFPADFQQVIASVNISVTFTRQMYGAESTDKNTLHQMQAYARSIFRMIFEQFENTFILIFSRGCVH